jgi:hypothetical protein
MRYEACLFFAISAVACSIYEQSQGNGAGGGAADPTTSGDTTAGAGGTDIGTSAGGASSATGGEGGGGEPTGPGTAGNGGHAGGDGSGGAAGGAGLGAGAGGSAAAGGSAGKTGAGGSSMGGSSGSGGSGSGGAGSGGAGGKAGAGGTQPTPDAGPDVGIGDSGAVCAPGTCKRVFVSLSSPAPSGKLGGVAAADTFCQTTADAKALGGSWRAWISDTTTSPSTRFTRASVPYRLLDGSTIAANWTALASGTLQHAINVHEDATPIAPAQIYEVWTGTRTNGTYSGNACANWTNDTNMSPTGDVGVTSVTNAGWTNLYQQFCDRTTIHVYCFEQ